MRMLEKAARDREEMIRVKKEADNNKERILAQMKVIQKREEQEAKARELYEEQKQRREKQEEVSRKIQEERLKRREAIE